MGLKERFYPESDFGGFSDVDGTIAFYSRVNALLRDDFIVADIGCGRGAYQGDPIDYRKKLRILKGKCSSVIGLDVDQEGANNPYIDDFRLIEDDTWYLDSNSIDLCLSDYVLEHIANPGKFFSECNRVLKDGGYLCMRTSNSRSYFGVFTRLMPDRLQIPFLKKIKGQKIQDKFPVLFHCNTLPKIRHQLVQNGFDGVVYGYDAEPDYFGFSGLLYWFGVLHQRYAPRMFKVGIFVFAQKINANHFLLDRKAPSLSLS